MPAPNDLSSAARRLAILARQHGDRDGYPNMRDLVVLLPVLDAVAAGTEDDRVERWARTMCVADDEDPDAPAPGLGATWRWEWYENQARTAIALADAERALLVITAERAWYLLDLRANCWAGDAPAREAPDNLRAALDAAVRRLSGPPDPA